MNERTIPIKSEVDELRAELAALREDLAMWKGRTTNVCMKLTAAEQRNSELVELLRDVSKQAGDHHASHQSWNLKTQLANIHQKIDAALKPTESGASE